MPRDLSVMIRAPVGGRAKAPNNIHDSVRFSMNNPLREQLGRAGASGGAGQAHVHLDTRTAALAELEDATHNRVRFAVFEVNEHTYTVRACA